ncbi:MAG: hypothetical protein ACT4QC_06125 [Planctomycetaceae bacterium]
MKRCLFLVAGLVALALSGCCCDCCNWCNPCGSPCGSCYAPGAAPAVSAVPGTYAPMTAAAPVESLPTY